MIKKNLETAEVNFLEKQFNHKWSNFYFNSRKKSKIQTK